jgi:hypothetical protein
MAIVFKDNNLRLYYLLEYFIKITRNASFYIKIDFILNISEFTSKYHFWHRTKAERISLIS